MQPGDVHVWRVAPGTRTRRRQRPVSVRHRDEPVSRHIGSLHGPRGRRRVRAVSIKSLVPERFVEEGRYHRPGESQTRRADVRVVVTTYGEPLWFQGRPLFDRLTPVRVPTLVERRQDIPLLARHFLREAARELPADRDTFLQESADGTLEPKVDLRLIEHLLHQPLLTSVRELDSVLRKAIHRAWSVRADNVRLSPQRPCDRGRAR